MKRKAQVNIGTIESSGGVSHFHIVHIWVTTCFWDSFRVSEEGIWWTKLGVQQDFEVTFSG